MSRNLPDLALLHQQYGPYHVARAHALVRAVNGRVHFLQLAAKEDLREWETPADAPRILSATDGVLEQIPVAKLVSGVCELLERLRPRVAVLAGYSHPAVRAAARWCRRSGAVSILLSDSNQVDKKRMQAKEWVKRYWVSSHFDAVFTAGTASAAYARQLGFDSSRIWRGYDVVDNSFFAHHARTAREEAAELRRELGLPERVFLYVGRFAPEKNLPKLLDAMRIYSDRAGPSAWGLMLVGNGPERAMLEARAARMRGVALVGFREGAALAKAYAAASALILPSVSEPWGLVVNEAMACGLPVLVSDRAGAAADLVRPGQNGYVFDPDDARDMAAAMLRLASGQVDLEAMGRMSEYIIAGYTPQTWAETLADAVEVTLERKRRGF